MSMSKTVTWNPLPWTARWLGALQASATARKRAPVSLLLLRQSLCTAFHRSRKNTHAREAIQLWCLLESVFPGCHLAGSHEDSHKRKAVSVQRVTRYLHKVLTCCLTGELIRVKDISSVTRHLHALPACVIMTACRNIRSRTSV